MTSTNLAYNSRKAWKTIRKLLNDPTTYIPPYLVSANQVTHQLLVNGRDNMPSTSKRPVLPPSNRRRCLHGIPSQRRRVQESNGIAKDNKAAGRDDVLVEQLKNIGRKVHRCYWQCSTNASWKIRSQLYGDSPRILPYRILGKTAILKSYRPYPSCVTHANSTKEW